MAIIKCKMCGGDIELTADKSFGTCEYCGNTMTLPKIDDEQRAAAFNRGNHFRRIGEFDKALAVYERIVREDDTDAEAHWCCALCRFGIEYVEDPATFEWMPTCHRASFDSFLEDVDYKAAVEYSDGITRRQYMKDGAKIAEVQRGILATSQNAEPYDVFICYKESDANGDRTRDSLMAQDIYYQLTEQGRKVFFARITLEDVVGTQYEPYIFAALNSAKVMIVVGTKAEYLNAVWVKNEWSRFLAMMKKDRSKLLLPCYRDMDPYDMPEQLSVLQSYDMGKIGFIQDLTRGIAKVLDAEKKPELVKETVVVQQSSAPVTNTAPLLERAFMFLEDGDWNSANEYCEKVLDIDPKNAQAYLGKLMAELRVRKQEDLKNQEKPFDGMNNYQKAIRFADDSLRTALNGYIEFINDRNEHDRLEGIYNKATSQKHTAKTEEEYKAAATTYGTIATYRDADALKQECLELAESTRKDAIYDKANSLFCRRSVADIEQAINQFNTIPGWKDADEKVIKCQQKIELIKREDEEKRIQDEKEKKIRTKKMIIGSSIGAAIVAVLIVLFTVIIPTINYNKADALLAAGDYEAAMEGFANIDNFKDAHVKYTEAFVSLKSSYKATADQLLNNGDYIQAAINYIKAGESTLAKHAYDFSSKLATTWAASAGVTNTNKLLYAASREELQGGNITDISSIAFFDEYDGIIGVDSSGKVVLQEGYYDFCSSDMRKTILSWKNIKQLEYGYFQTFALLNDGTVVAAYDDPQDDYYYPVNSSMSSWKNIVEIGNHKYDLWAIDANGQFYYAGVTKNKKASNFDLSDFSSIKKVQFGNGWLLGLTTDGKIVTSKDRNDNYGYLLPSEIKNISQKVNDIIISGYWVFVLQEDGTVVAARFDKDKSDTKYDYSKCISTVQTGLSTWKGIVYVQSVAHGVIGEDIHGNMYFQSTSTKSESDYVYIIENREDIKATIEGWKNIVYISSNSWDYDKKESNNYLGLHTDGTVSSLGTGKYLTLEDGYSGYYALAHYDGAYDKVDSWKLW